METIETPVITFITYDQRGEDGGYRALTRTDATLFGPSETFDDLPDLDACHNLKAELGAFYVKNMKVVEALAPLVETGIRLRQLEAAKTAAITDATAGIAAALKNGATEGAIAGALRVSRPTVRAWQGKDK